jgi:hypothetical protein
LTVTPLERISAQREIFTLVSSHPKNRGRII